MSAKHERYTQRLEEKYGKDAILVLDPFINNKTPLRHYNVVTGELEVLLPRAYLHDRHYLVTPDKTLTQQGYIQRLNGLYGDKVFKPVDKYVDCRTPLKHKGPTGTFISTPFNMLQGWGRTRALGGINPKQFTDEDYKNLIAEYTQGLISPIEEYKGALYKHKLQCSCGNIWKSRLDVIRKHKPTLCPKCNNASRYSKIGIAWLKKISRLYKIRIKHSENSKGEKEIKLGTSTIRVDGFSKKYNVVFEFYGDHFHGNLNKFKPMKKCHPYQKNKTAKSLHKATMQREQKLIGLGYTVISIWEHEYKTDFDGWLARNSFTLRRICARDEL